MSSIPNVDGCPSTKFHSQPFWNDSHLVLLNLDKLKEQHLLFVQDERVKNAPPKLFILPPSRSDITIGLIGLTAPKMFILWSFFTLTYLKGLLYFDYARVLFDDWFPVLSLGGQHIAASHSQSHPLAQGSFINDVNPILHIFCAMAYSPLAFGSSLDFKVRPLK